MNSRRSVRLKDYDYSLNGGYFVTICTSNRINFFGHIENGEMLLNECGKIAKDIWSQLPKQFPGLVLDEYVIMPNHIHGIMLILKNDLSSVGV